MIVLGVDPGQTTGFCLLKNCQGRQRVYSLLEAGQILWDRRKLDMYALLSGTYRTRLPVPEAIVIESFRLRPGRAMEQVGSTFPSVQVIGNIEAFQFALSLSVPLIFQEPSIISRVEILPEHEDRLTGKPHAQDAYKHARYYLVKGGY